MSPSDLMYDASTQIFIFLQKSQIFLTISKVNLFCVILLLIDATNVVLLN